MQNFLMLAPAIARTSSFGSSAGDGRVGMIDARDVAAVAAQIAVSPALHAGNTYWPTGPERLSYSDAAAVLSKVLGRPITFHPLTFDEERRAMIGAGVPETAAEDNARTLNLFAQGDADYVTDDVPRSSAARRVPSNSSPLTTPPPSHEAQATAAAVTARRYAPLSAWEQDRPLQVVASSSRETPVEAPQSRTIYGGAAV